ncbi:MAG TPA: DinB family protein [Luteimonas sp.]|nr:DinB family protein [Luteimonas sp.]
MSRTAHVALMAEYNAWMNGKLYEAVARLPAEEIARERGAFFGSILGTLNHLAVADTIWLKRFSEHPARHAALEPLRGTSMPQRLDEPLFEDFPGLRAQRERMDAVIREWTAALTEADLSTPLRYVNLRGQAFVYDTFALLMHFFNHQTHHRGQVTTLLSQAGEDVGATDLLVLIPAQDAVSGH